MSFPTSHKTVFVLDHTLSKASGVRIDLESLNKNKNNQSQSSISQIPLLPVVKTIWTCAVEALTEYCRIVWDIFPGSKIIRFITVDNEVTKLNGWNVEEQNLNSLMQMFINLEPAKVNIKPDTERGLKVAVEALTEPTAIQQEKRSSTSNASKVLNKGRIILVTKIENEDEIVLIRNKCQELLILQNKIAAATDNFMVINHCELIFLNFGKEGDVNLINNKTWPVFSQSLSCELFNIRCGNALAPKLCSLVLKHYNLASTTVTGIPMKEEQNASSSANYDVELFHPSSAHTAILKGASSETTHLRTVREGTDYETVTLKWCTPRSSASSELQHCSSAYRITSVDVNSRPSSCLTNFLLNGRWVMLEMPRKSGSKVLSHMLASHGGDIYIHTLHTNRSVIEDPPSISESVGGRVTDYRIPDFGRMIRMNMLAPYSPLSKSYIEEEMSTTLEKSIELLSRHTKIWPMTNSSTYLFTLVHTVSPLVRLMIKDNLTEDELNDCKNVIFVLMKMEENNEPLPVNVNVKGSKFTSKKEEQYKILWLELEEYLRMHSNYSPRHKSVLDCLLECQNKFGKESNQLKTDRNTKNSKEKSNHDQPSKRRKIEHSAPLNLVTSKNSKQNLLTLLTNKMNSERSKKSLEFVGRLKAENNFTKLYPNFQKDKEKDEASRNN